MRAKKKKILEVFKSPIQNGYSEKLKCLQTNNCSKSEILIMRTMNTVKKLSQQFVANRESPISTKLKLILLCIGTVLQICNYSHSYMFALEYILVQAHGI